jgi:hypothetical protein
MSEVPMALSLAYVTADKVACFFLTTWMPRNLTQLSWEQLQVASFSARMNMTD